MDVVVADFCDVVPMFVLGIPSEFIGFCLVDGTVWIWSLCPLAMIPAAPDLDVMSSLVAGPDFRG